VWRLVGVCGTRRSEIVPESNAFPLQQPSAPPCVGTRQFGRVVAQRMQRSENAGRFSRGAIFSRPQRRQTDSQRPRELCLTNPECASQADEGIVGAMELPQPDPRNLFPHHLTLIECISLSSRFRLSKVMTNRKKQASIMRTIDNRLKATARAMISPRIQR
jgi:hypothetical protein